MCYFHRHNELINVVGGHFVGAVPRSLYLDKLVDKGCAKIQSDMEKTRRAVVRLAETRCNLHVLTNLVKKTYLLSKAAFE